MIPRLYTVRHVGVAHGCNNDNVYIPTSAEVYDSIDQDRLFATDDDNDNASSDPAPAFLGMVLTANDDDNDDKVPEQEEMDDGDSQQLPRGFDVNSPTNILATAIHQVALARTSTEAEAEGWFESVRAKLRICGIRSSTEYQELYGASAEESSPIEQSVGRAINTRIHNNHFRPMIPSTLRSINDYINTLLAGEAHVHPVVFPGLPEDERPITDFESFKMFGHMIKFMLHFLDAEIQKTYMYGLNNHNLKHIICQNKKHMSKM